MQQTTLRYFQQLETALRTLATLEGPASQWTHCLDSDFLEMLGNAGISPKLIPPTTSTV